MKPIFTRLSSRDMLLGCQRGLTQNQNESLNNLVWSRCLKRLFYGIHRYTISVCDGVSHFNDGAKGRYYLLQTLNINVGDNSLRGLKREQRLRLRKAASKVTDKHKNRRQILRSNRKNTKDKSYIAGAFIDKSVPEIDFTNEPDVSIPVTFIHEKDVPFVVICPCV